MDLIGGTPSPGTTSIAVFGSSKRGGRWIAGGVEQLGAPTLMLVLTLIVAGVVGLDRLRRRHHRETPSTGQPDRLPVDD